jgi:hypothetical protein
MKLLYLLCICFVILFGSTYFMDDLFKNRIQELDRICTECIINKTSYNITFSEFYNETNGTIINEIRYNCSCCWTHENWSRTMYELDNYAH